MMKGLMNSKVIVIFFTALLFCLICQSAVSAYTEKDKATVKTIFEALKKAGYPDGKDYSLTKQNKDEWADTMEEDGETLFFSWGENNDGRHLAKVYLAITSDGKILQYEKGEWVELKPFAKKCCCEHSEKNKPESKNGDKANETAMKHKKSGDQGVKINVIAKPLLPLKTKFPEGITYKEEYKVESVKKGLTPIQAANEIINRPLSEIYNSFSKENPISIKLIDMNDNMGEDCYLFDVSGMHGKKIFLVGTQTSNIYEILSGGGVRNWGNGKD